MEVEGAQVLPGVNLSGPGALAAVSPPLAETPAQPGYVRFSRAAWARLAKDDASPPSSTTSPANKATLRTLAELIRLRARSEQARRRKEQRFLGLPAPHAPFVVGLSGSVAAGKSRLAAELADILRDSLRLRVSLVSTDGFLHPNRWLAAQGLIARKGFPESYDTAAMLSFLAGARAGWPSVRAPIYCHERFDVREGEWQEVRRPDVLLFEGLNALQLRDGGRSRGQLLDLGIYLDADEADLAAWYEERSIQLRRDARQAPPSYFAETGDAKDVARRIWREINLLNLVQHIAPSRRHADVILRKQSDHGISDIWLRMDWASASLDAPESLFERSEA